MFLDVFFPLELEKSINPLILKYKTSLLLFCDNLFVRQGTCNRPFIRGMIILRKFGASWDDLLTVTIHFLAAVSCFKGTSYV